WEGFLAPLARSEPRTAGGQQPACVPLVEQARLRGFGGRGGFAECGRGTHGWATWCSFSVSAAPPKAQALASTSASTTRSGAQPLFRYAAAPAVRARWTSSGGGA